jgi:phospholipid/cholesterol/gamma-HCH transport system substrate-binding protein
MRSRIAALAALGAVAVAVIVILGGGGDSYKVTGHFESASQLVGGEVVVLGGVTVGGVEEIELGDDNEALITFNVQDDYAPLPRGTVATVRSFSLSGIANRQVQLTLPASDEAGEPIPDGGELNQTETISEVDLDQLFNTLDAETVRDLKSVIRGFADSYDGVGRPANKGFRYLNPFLSTSRRVFDELNRDQGTLERLIVDADRLSGALAERRDSVAGLIRNASDSMGALASERDSLAAAIAQLPPFMRQFNTTAVNLRPALDDVDPLVDASKPVAEKLRPFLAELNSASDNLVPTIRDLNGTIDTGGSRDLVGLTALAPALAKIAVGPVRRNGEQRQGAFPESVDSLRDSLPILEQLRPYAPELVGWFDDFSHSGIVDANGGVGRFSLILNAFSPGPSGLPLLDPGNLLAPVDLLNLFSLGNDRRCPGSNERPATDGSNPFTDGGNVNCDPTQLPIGN